MTDDLREYKAPEGASENFAAADAESPKGPDFGRDLSLQEVRKIYVGPGFSRYEKCFAKSDATGRPTQDISVAAFFFSFAWFFYRKMYVEGAVIMAAILSLGLLLSYLDLSHGILRGVGTGVSAGLAISAKGFYWRAVNKKIAMAMDLYPHDPREAVAWLAARGGVNHLAIILGALIVALPILGALYD